MNKKILPNFTSPPTKKKEKPNNNKKERGRIYDADRKVAFK